MGKHFFLFSFVSALAAAPFAASALDTNFFGPIIPQSGTCVCAGGAMDWGCILQVFQALLNLSVTVSVIVVTLLIAWAGLMFIMNPANPANRTKARNRLLNAILGMVLIFGSWILVDTIMKVLYNPDTAFNGQTFGPWNEIFDNTNASECVRVNLHPGILNDGSLPETIGHILNPGTTDSSIGVAKGLCADSNKYCSVAVMKTEGLNDAQARAMSCIAVTESGGNPNIGGSGTGAQGLFQITGTNWRNPAFHSGSCTVNSSRDNGECNRQAAVLMLKKQGYQPWTGKCNNPSGCGKVSNGQYWNPNAVACVAKYDPH